MQIKTFRVNSSFSAFFDVKRLEHQSLSRGLLGGLLAYLKDKTEHTFNFFTAACRLFESNMHSAKIKLDSLIGNDGIR